MSGNGTIIKDSSSSRYAKISNVPLRDTRLSLAAVGLLAIMLSMSSKWEYSVHGLTAVTGSGETALRTALMQLEKYGYVRRTRERGEGGRYGGTRYVISDNPPADYPAVDFPRLENLTQRTTNIRNNNNKNKQQQQGPVVVEKNEDKGDKDNTAEKLHTAEKLLKDTLNNRTRKGWDDTDEKLRQQLKLSASVFGDLQRRYGSSRIAAAAAAMRQQRHLNNPAGYFLAALSGGWQAGEVIISSSSRYRSAAEAEYDPSREVKLSGW